MRWTGVAGAQPWSRRSFSSAAPRRGLHRASGSPRLAARLRCHRASTAHPWDDLLARGRHAEATGWDRLYVADHFMPNATGPADGPA